MVIRTFIVILVSFLTACEAGSGHHEHDHDHSDNHEYLKDSTRDEEHAHDQIDADHEFTTLTASVAHKSGVRTSFANEAEIHDEIQVRGKIIPAEDLISHVIPRFSGVVLEGKKHIGDRVKSGELLARIESNESLRPFEVRSRINGVVVNGHLIVGEYVPEDQWVYIIANLDEVWADFFVPLRKRNSLKVGQKVLISSPTQSGDLTATLSYIAPYADERSQTQLVRAVVKNEDNLLLPGMFVNGKVEVGVTSASVAVSKKAIVDFKGQAVVFVREQERYSVREIERGVSDSSYVQIVSGLSKGEEYVSENAYLVKADILKSGASHDH